MATNPNLTLTLCATASAAADASEHVFLVQCSGSNYSGKPRPSTLRLSGFGLQMFKRGNDGSHVFHSSYAYCTIESWSLAVRDAVGVATQLRLELQDGGTLWIHAPGGKAEEISDHGILPRSLCSRNMQTDLLRGRRWSGQTQNHNNLR